MPNKASKKFHLIKLRQLSNYNAAPDLNAIEALKLLYSYKLKLEHLECDLRLNHNIKLDLNA